jgi:hypothetical protein
MPRSMQAFDEGPKKYKTIDYQAAISRAAWGLFCQEWYVVIILI